MCCVTVVRAEFAVLHHTYFVTLHSLYAALLRSSYNAWQVGW